MDSLSLLSESLPNAKLVSAERDMSNDFKAAAQSLASFYKSSRQTVKHAHDAGYAACLQDMLQFIQTGLSTAAAENDAMGVARVMDWVEGQLERFREGKEFEGRGEPIEEASASTSTAQRSFSPPRRHTIAASASTEQRSPSHTPRRAESSATVVDLTPIPAPSFSVDATPAAKRRHAAITTAEPTSSSRRRPRAFAAPVAPTPLDSRPQRRIKRGGVAERDRGVVVESRSSDSMDFDEDEPRERKRSRTARSDSASSAT
ncbi:hypothetical protein BDV93DRAFT_525018 [Ceratobasidium sp. AG-I]|nr:hypothetical protein BDV93DRAFT_525018 [Ceratobasidium sp. AG-I]